MNRLWGVAVFIFLAQGLQAQGTGPLYVVDGEFAGGQTSTLYRINPNDAAVLDVVGDTGENLLTIAVDLENGDLLGLTTSNSANADALVRLDPYTAEVIQVLPLISPQGEEMPDFLDMFYSETLETLLALASRSTQGQPPLHYLVSPEGGQVTGAQNVEGSTAVRGETLGVAERLASSLTAGNLMVVGCDATTGESRLVGYWVLGPGPPFDPPPPTSIWPLPDETCVTAGTRRAGSDTYYGVGVPFAEGASRTLLRIDLSGDGSAAVETLGPLPDDAAGIAFGPIPQPSAVPALGGTGRALLVGLLLLAAGLMVRRSAGSARHREG